ncbi:GNAT family N-acetyltransferase [Mammaliicoccus stepanovicii]|uniref:Ribosomal-protein-L7p-serine acetyltransferase n=1 Tax=Mammaliicoccus stepanovicii TaxID=643214 RepID=A0A239ZBY7_9STAP|nr:GNAT family N-acetyltransferase [Mammaliicoccus stepanovicii]PNZ74119.1 N-acetyltransferase [Mammaliicoccus stepanovicii]GGI42110.1 ribosomal-protein-serine acetyltransferase [Mammaliicoccus stepanovicii]SNV68407.1 Ribosomal-protein-L7p-serine acetyltransferase [Mammaliicoccus stepanovicii]
MNSLESFDLKLETERLVILAGNQVWAYKDTIKEEMINSARDLKEWIGFFNYNFDESKVVEFINMTTDISNNSSFLRYFLFEKQTMDFVGSVVLQDIDYRLPSCEIGYWTVTSQQGNGYMTEAIRQITQYLIEYRQFVRIEAYIDVKNVKSIQTIEDCEFEREGMLKNSDLNANETKLINEVLYALTTPIHFKQK